MRAAVIANLSQLRVVSVAHSGDVALALRGQFAAAMRHLHPDHPNLTAAYERPLDLGDDGEFLVFTIGERLVGMVAVRWNNAEHPQRLETDPLFPAPLAGPVAELKSGLVHPAVQRNGIAEIGLTEAVERASCMGAATAIYDTGRRQLPVVSLARKLSFTRIQAFDPGNPLSDPSHAFALEISRPEIANEFWLNANQRIERFLLRSFSFDPEGILRMDAFPELEDATFTVPALLAAKSTSAVDLRSEPHPQIV